jgi:threonyl-tRNA synthetase
MKVNLPDGTELQLEDGASGADAARAIGEGLARAALGIRLDGELRDLEAPLEDGAKIEIVTARDDDGLWLIRHDAAHVLATAVMELYPGVKISIGPPIEDGFYYDFDFPDGTKVSEEDFEAIEARMREHIKANEHFEREDVSVPDAIERFRSEGQDYKVELIEDLVEDQGVDTVSLYRNGPFTDLCRGPHGPGTKDVRAFKLTSLAGAYWRGDANNPMLTRIYGTAWGSKEQLEEHVKRLEEARARDHRKLGRELDLFLLSELSPGSPFWLPNGTHIWNELTKLWRKTNVERGYQEVRTPILYDVELWKQSGHWHVYRDNMYFTDVEGKPMGLKPMNCPAHVQIYKRDLHSYRDLPIRLAEQGLVHRHEPSGTLHGLLRVRHITQDDAHVFCREDQIEEEVVRCLDFGFYIYDQFGLTPRLELSTRPEKRVGTEEMWDKAEAALQQALENQGLEYDLNEGDGAFYGPKIDLHMTDVLGRPWQMGTIQLDSQMPRRFGLRYVASDNREHTPYVIHRALLGSLERFIGILIEHFGGAFPAWLAPVQARVIPVAEAHRAGACAVAAELESRGVRVDVDEASETLAKRIRNAELEKIPYVVVFGEKEAGGGTLALRVRGERDVSEKPREAALEQIAQAATL